jgi:hypothetical protein
MKTKKAPRKGDWIAATLAKRMAKDFNCPIYDGVGEIPQSESPYVIVLAPDRLSAWRVRRKEVEGGIPEDFDAIVDEALLDGMEESDEAYDWDKPYENRAIDDWDQNIIGSETRRRDDPDSQAQGQRRGDK